MFGGDEVVYQDYEFEQEVHELMAYERKGNVGILKYGTEDMLEENYIEKIVIYRTPQIRSRAEIMAEQQRLLKLGVFEDDTVCENNMLRVS